MPAGGGDQAKTNPTQGPVLAKAAELKRCNNSNATAAIASYELPAVGKESPSSHCSPEAIRRAATASPPLKREAAVPQLSAHSLSLGADLGSCDEVKVWTEEGEEESEMTCSERLQAELQEDPGPPLIPVDPPDPPSPLGLDLPGKSEPDGSPFTPPGYLGLSPYTSYPHPPSLGRVGSPLSPFFYPEHLGSPPPAHMGGIPYSLDPHKGPVGFRGYPFGSQYSPYPVLSPDLTSWCEGMNLRQSFPMFPSSVSLASAISRFSASGLFGGGGFGSPPLSPPPGLPLLNQFQVKLEPGLKAGSKEEAKKKPHIKKPLNAFMLYMKEMRPKVVAECTLKESAAINQILGRKWHALSREEQAKYYEQARKERQLHMQMYPGWSARDNYAQTKKKKRKREKTQELAGNPMKKCRARFGLEQQDMWCKPCKPEEALDGVGDNVPMYHHHHMTPQNGGHHVDSQHAALSLVTEPLLDLRNFSQMNGCGLATAGTGNGCPPNHDSSDLSESTGQSPKYICL